MDALGVGSDTTTAAARAARATAINRNYDRDATKQLIMFFYDIINPHDQVTELVRSATQDVLMQPMRTRLRPTTHSSRCPRRRVRLAWQLLHLPCFLEFATTYRPTRRG